MNSVRTSTKIEIYFKKSELKNIVTEIKNTLEGLNIRLRGAEECIRIWKSW